MEEYKIIPNFSNYKVSKNGVLVSYLKEANGRVLKFNLSHNGYYQTSIKNDEGIFKLVRANRIVGITWIPNPENKPQINHINAIKTDNRVENLEWVTPKENGTHAANMGLYNNLTGADHVWAKGVLNVETGVFYDTIKEAAKSDGLNKNTLRDSLVGRYNTKTKFVLI